MGCDCGCVARCGLAHRKTNRRAGARDPGVGSEAGDVGVEACSYVTSHAGHGPLFVDSIPKKSEVTVGRKSAKDVILQRMKAEIGDNFE